MDVRVKINYNNNKKQGEKMATYFICVEDNHVYLGDNEAFISDKSTTYETLYSDKEFDEVIANLSQHMKNGRFRGPIGKICSPCNYIIFNIDPNGAAASLSIQELTQDISDYLQ